LNLVFVGTGNPTPVLNGPVRPGDNKWTGSIVAINPDTGAVAWGFQASPHDTHDWDASEVPVLVDADFGGARRKLLLQASRNGYYFVLDPTNGKNLLTTPFATVNWAKGVDNEGRPIPLEDKEPSRDGRLVAPDEAGGTNYRSPSFDPPTALLVVRSPARATPTPSTSTTRSTGSTAGPAPTTTCTDAESCARSSIRPARSAGVT